MIENVAGMEPHKFSMGHWHVSKKLENVDGIGLWAGQSNANLLGANSEREWGAIKRFVIVGVRNERKLLQA